MKTWKSIGFAALILALTACASVVRVSRMGDPGASGTGAGDGAGDDDPANEKVDGVPFYLKVGKFKQTTTYREEWIEATLAVTQAAPAAAGAPAKVRLLMEVGSAFRSAALPRLRELQQKLLVPGDATVLRGILDEFGAMARDPQLTGPELVETPWSNVVEPILTVDYSRPYFINAPMPWFGTGSLTSKLNGDGTLSETTGSTQSTAAEGVASLLPLKEFLVGKFVPAAPAPADTTMKSLPVPGVADKGAPLVASMRLDRKGRAYRFTRIFDSDPCTAAAGCGKLAFDRSKGNYTTQELGQSPDKGDDRSAAAISVKGTIELPKAAAE